MSHFKAQHEGRAAAFEARHVKTGEVRAFGTLAVASAYAEILAVYRKQYGKVPPRPQFLLEWFYAKRVMWVDAERSLQKLTLSQMVRLARANPKFYRVVVFDYNGTRQVVNANGVRVAGDPPRKG